MRALLLALGVLLVLPAGASARDARRTVYRGLGDQNQPVRLTLDHRARTLAFRIGYLARCVGTGGESEGTRLADPGT